VVSRFCGVCILSSRRFTELDAVRNVYFIKDRDSQKTTWIAKFVEEVKNDRMVLPALKQIREIFQLFSEVCLLRLAVVCYLQHTCIYQHFFTNIHDILELPKWSVLRCVFTKQNHCGATFHCSFLLMLGIFLGSLIVRVDLPQFFAQKGD